MMQFRLARACDGRAREVVYVLPLLLLARVLFTTAPFINVTTRYNMLAPVQAYDDDHVL